ncbi:MAG TPA: plastocyanin/azurin family copper-binding protein [Acidimicrobiia bacterium]|jgi:plastocyanin
MKELRDRVLIPLAIPLSAAVVIVIVVLNFSRILLAVEERGSEKVATAIAILVASGVLFGAAWFSARGEERSGRNISALVGAGLVLVLAGVVGAEAIEEERREAAAEAGTKDLGPPDLTVTAGPGLTFAEKQLSTHSGKVVVEYKDADTAAHTLLFEGVPGFKLEVSGKDDTAKGEADLKPGTVIFYCDIPGHRQAGMEGTLTVAEGAGGAAGEAAADVVAKPGLHFEPPEIAVPAGPVKVTLRNEDTQLHTLSVEGQPKFKKLEATGKGESQTGTLEVGPGTYTLYCDVPGHRAAGMHTTLKVG